MLEQIYCHTLPTVGYNHKFGFFKVGEWYYYHAYRAATSDAEPKDYTHFDIKEGNNRWSSTKLCMHLNSMHLFFYTKDEYRNNLISELID